MRVATWNVNSLRARLPHVLPWLERAQPDVLCLQEVKCVDEQFPREPLAERGWCIECFGQKTYNGVALLARVPVTDVVRGMPGDEPGKEARVIAGTVGGTRIVNAYVVNGQAVGTEKYAYKLGWLARFADYVARERAAHERLLVTGDFNVTFDDRDVHDPAAWHEKILCSTPERLALAKVLADAGLADAFRHFTPEGGHYTWWDFRTRGFQRGDGLRIDHVLLSPAALAACRSVTIDVDARKGEKPSDHAPVVATLEAA
jgi:exodeoxyribonuclease III